MVEQNEQKTFEKKINELHDKLDNVVSLFSKFCNNNDDKQKMEELRQRHLNEIKRIDKRYSDGMDNLFRQIKHIRKDQKRILNGLDEAKEERAIFRDAVVGGSNHHNLINKGGVDNDSDNGGGKGNGKGNGKDNGKDNGTNDDNLINNFGDNDSNDADNADGNGGNDSLKPNIFPDKNKCTEQYTKNNVHTLKKNDNNDEFDDENSANVSPSKSIDNTNTNKVTGGAVSRLFAIIKIDKETLKKDDERCCYKKISGQKSTIVNTIKQLRAKYGEKAVKIVIIQKYTGDDISAEFFEYLDEGIVKHSIKTSQFRIKKRKIAEKDIIAAVEYLTQDTQDDENTESDDDDDEDNEDTESDDNEGVDE